MTLGDTISHYRILSFLGAGGMGEVDKAEDTRLKRAVALKFLPLPMLQDEQAKQCLLIEARAISALDRLAYFGVGMGAAIAPRVALPLLMLDGRRENTELLGGPRTSASGRGFTSESSQQSAH